MDWISDSAKMWCFRIWGNLLYGGYPFLFSLGRQFETEDFAADFKELNIKGNQNCLYIPSSGGQQHEKSKIH
jgi:hypothetical protein